MKPHYLIDELSSVIFDDDRKPLPRADRPVDENVEDMRTKASTRKKVMAILRGGVELSLGNIAARVLERERDVERALLVMRMAGDVERTSKPKSASDSKWRAAA